MFVLQSFQIILPLVNEFPLEDKLTFRFFVCQTEISVEIEQNEK